jgi:hypothetical protein
MIIHCNFALGGIKFSHIIFQCRLVTGFDFKSFYTKVRNEGAKSR